MKAVIDQYEYTKSRNCPRGRSGTFLGEAVNPIRRSKLPKKPQRTIRPPSAHKNNKVTATNSTIPSHLLSTDGRTQASQQPLVHAQPVLQGQGWHLLEVQRMRLSSVIASLNARLRENCNGVIFSVVRVMQIAGMLDRSLGALRVMREVG